MAKGATPHVDEASRYARDVVTRRRSACLWVRLACQRHLDDVARSTKTRYPFTFKPEEAERACVIVEHLPHVKGQWARNREPITLRPWQAFIVCCTFGWYVKRNGRRRFTEVYVEVPRKNGKSIIAAAIGIVMFAFDNEFGAEVYSGATTEKQAWEVFRPARQMLERSPHLQRDMGIELWAKVMVRPEDGSRFQPVIGKPGDGASPSCAIIDEYHEHDTSDLYDTMITGMAARQNPLCLIITTAGTNIAGPCYDKHLEVQRMLQNAIPNDHLFGIIYGLDQGDDWQDPKMMMKANPNWGVSVDEEYLKAAHRRAITNAGEQTRFKTKHLNEWCSAKAAWMSLLHWDACGDPKLRPEQFADAQGLLVFDLASRIDICALVLMFKRRIDARDHYYAFGHYFIPEDLLTDDANPNASAYRKWVIEGRMRATPGSEIDFDTVSDVARKAAAAFACDEGVYDPWRATQLAQQLTADGMTMIEYRASVQMMSPAMKEMDAAIRSGRFHHDGDPVLRWMIGNVVANVRPNEMVTPTKQKAPFKIDGAVACIMGVGRLMSPVEAVATPAITLL